MAPSSGSSDGKDFLEQLRTVHFSLVILCVTAVVVVNLPDRTRFMRADDELKDITSIVARWDKNIIATAAEDVAKGHPQCMPATPFFQVFPNSGSNVHIVRMWDVNYPGFPVRWNEPNTNPPSRLQLLPVVDAPLNLSQFQRIWESEGTLECPDKKVEPKKLWGIIFTDEDFSHYQFFERPNPVISRPVEGTFQRDFVLVAPRSFEEWPPTLQVQKKEDLNRTLLVQTGDTLPVKNKNQDRFAIEVARPQPFAKVYVRSRLTANLPKDDIFSKAFPDLSLSAIGKEALSFDKLQRYLQTQQSDEKEVFEAFGIKFPIDSAARWATILIFATQAYFWIHLAEYYRRNFPASSVAWIGSYPGRAAKIMSAVTFILVPFGVAIDLAYKQKLIPPRSSSRLGLFEAVSAGAVLMSITLAAVTAITYAHGARAEVLRLKEHESSREA